MLDSKLAQISIKIDNVRSELSESLSAQKTAILAELETLEAAVNSELKTIKAVLEILKNKDVELEEQIAELKKYVNTELIATEDWASATFATLEQYEAVTTLIGTIEGTIDGLNESINVLETRLKEKIAKDIETISATFSSDLQETVTEITTAYTAAITTAQQDITSAYTAALQSAIATSEASMKEWVNERLASYYTIAEIDAKISVLELATTDGDEALKKELDTLKELIAKQKSEMTEAYQTAIAEAITINNGMIDEKIAAEIVVVNEKIADIESHLADLEPRLAKMEKSIDSIEERIKALVGRIQSISYIPKFSDSKASIDKVKKIGVFDFKVSPKDAIADLETVWQSVLTMQSVYTQTTRTVSFIELPITYFEADEDNGTISIEVDATNLGDTFFLEEIEACAALNISAGNTNIISDFIPLVVSKQPNN